MSMTIKEAKAYRCEAPLDRNPNMMDWNRWCKLDHNTCRRCELHTEYFNFNGKSGLCDLCYKEYQEWYNETIRKPALKQFDAEKKIGLEPDWSPFFLMAAYAEWIKEAPRKNKRIIDI